MTDRLDEIKRRASLYPHEFRELPELPSFVLVCDRCGAIVGKEFTPDGRQVNVYSARDGDREATLMRPPCVPSP